MSRLVFISYIDEDFKYKTKISKWARQGKLGPNIVVAGVEDLEVWDEEDYLLPEKLAWKLKESEFVIVLVGENVEGHPWLEWEGEFCHQWGIKRFVMRIPYTEADLPTKLINLSEIAYNPNAIEKQLRTPNQANFW